MKALSTLPTLKKPGLANNLKTAAQDVTNGFLALFHNGLALIGFSAAIVVLALLSQPDLRHQGESKLFSWLQIRHSTTGASTSQEEAIAVAALDASNRATATDPADLPKQQAAVAYWLSKKYRVAPEPLSALVAEAYVLGAKAKLEPTLILAIMAIESGFNPFAQSDVGAQGLMQVMTKVHSDKYENFGGKLAAFDPITNIRVGVKVLQDCIARAGSIEGGLKFYVGAANLPDDGGYAGKVFAEYARLYQIAYGKAAPNRRTMPESALSIQGAREPSEEVIQPVIVPVIAPVKPAADVAVEKIAAL